MTLPQHQYVYRARPLRVVDGDTVYVIIDLGMRVQTTVSIRIRDVDTPELFRGDDREAGAAARTFTEDWMANAVRLADDPEWSLLVATRKDKQSFNRYVADIWRSKDGRNLGDDLVTSEHATRVR